MELEQKWNAQYRDLNTEYNDIFTMKYSRNTSTKSPALGAGNFS